MKRHHNDEPARDANERNATPLLARVRESVSIVDRLMEMPLPGEGEDSSSPEWDAAVARRLESALARQMRSLIEGDPERRSA